MEFQSTADWNLVVASALHAWRALLYHGVGVDAFTGAFPLLIRELLFVQHNVSVDPDDIATATGATSRKRLGTVKKRKEKRKENHSLDESTAPS